MTRYSAVVSIAPSEPDVAEDPHAEDEAWRRARPTIAPLAFGVIGLTLSPLLLGLILGPIGVRAGVDLWRAGLRRSTVAVGIAASALAIVVSVLSALLWGSLLTTVLLGRDAIRETERWRGETLREASPAFLPLEGQQRAMVMLEAAANGPCLDLLQNIAELAPSHPECRLVIVESAVESGHLGAELKRLGLGATVLPADSPLPWPLDQATATPTLVVIDAAGRIECALVGSRPAAELERILTPSAPRSDTAAPPVDPTALRR